MKKFPVALQLYSVRDDMAADFAGTLEKVAGMGYQGVEFAGLYDHTPDEVRALCERYGLTPISAHVPYAEMIADPAGVLGAYKAIGCRYIAIPYYQWNFAESGESYEQFIANVRLLGKTANDLGMTLLYHNHDFEFEKISGMYALDFLYAAIPEDVLKTEIDVCWVKYAGEDPAAYLRKYAGRAPVVHLKDFVGRKEGDAAPYGLLGQSETKAAGEVLFEFRPVGYGCQDVSAVAEAGLDAGAKWFVVEQDASVGRTPLEAAAMSIDTLRKIRLKG